MTTTINMRLLADGCDPKRQTDGAAGFDLVAREDAVVPARGRVTVPVGIALELPTGHEGQIRPRSGLARAGIEAAFGVIDSDYRGEVSVTLYNHTDVDFTIEAGKRIAQLVVAPVLDVHFVRVEVLSETARGAKGFGSSG